MPHELDHILGRRAVTRGWITEAQLAEAFECQQREVEEGKPARLIVAILAQRGYLTSEQVDQLLDENARTLLRVEKEVDSEALTRGRDPATPAPSSDAAPPERFGRYKLLSVLGRGGMGIVYRTRDPQLGREIALKVMTGDANQEEGIRFLREARALARLRHPNIVQVYEVGEEQGRPYYTMELVEGEGLGAILRRMRVVPLNAALKLARAVALALAEVHRNGFVHRDVKPSNILVARTAQGEASAAGADTSLLLVEGETASYRILLSDFGLVRELDATRLTRSTQVMGTPLYMSPEQARGDTRAMGSSSDLYSLGAVLYEMLGGRPPFAEPEVALLLAKIQLDDPPSLRALAPGIPRDVDTIVQKAIAKEPERRYASAAAFAEDLDRYLRGDVILARPASWAYRMSKRIARHKALSAAITLAFLVLAGAGWMFYGPGWVELEVNEPGARIMVDGKDRGTARRLLLWPPGRYDIEASLPGHLPDTREVDVLAGKTLRVVLVLQADSGSLSVEVSPPNATIRLSRSGHPAGEAAGSQEALRLPVGTYLATIEAPDHRPITTAFDIRPDENEHLLPIRLEHEFGYLWAETNVEGATLRIYPATEQEFRRASGEGEPIHEAPAVVWQYSWRNRKPQGRAEQRVAPKTTFARPIWGYQVPDANPLHQLSLPVERFRIDTGWYRLIYGGKNCVMREQYVHIDPALSDDELRKELEEELRLKGLKIRRLLPIQWGFHIDDIKWRTWRDYRVRPGRTPCVATLENRERWSCATGGRVSSSSALAELDGDGYLDHVTGSGDSKVYAFSGKDGQLLWEYKTGGAVSSTPAMADLNRDGVPDFLLGSGDSNVYALSGKNGKPIWSFSTGGEVDSSPGLADLDGDGILECVMGSFDGILHAISIRPARMDAEAPRSARVWRENPLLLRARRAACRESWRAVELDCLQALESIGAPGAEREAQQAVTLALFAKARIRSGRAGEVLANLREVAAALPGNAEVRFYLALATDSRDEATSAMAAALLLDPISVWQLHEVRSDTTPSWPRSGQVADLAREAERVLADPTRFQAVFATTFLDFDSRFSGRRRLFARGVALLIGNLSREALPLFDSLLKVESLDQLDRDALDHILLRGRARLDSGDPRDALADWNVLASFAVRFSQLDSWIREAKSALARQRENEEP